MSLFWFCILFYFILLLIYVFILLCVALSNLFTEYTNFVFITGMLLLFKTLTFGNFWKHYMTSSHACKFAITAHFTACLCDASPLISIFICTYIHAYGKYIYVWVKIYAFVVWVYLDNMRMQNSALNKRPRDWPLDWWPNCGALRLKCQKSNWILLVLLFLFFFFL